MTQQNYIQDNQLPPVLNFETLKEEGLAYIQEHTSTEWTNLNPGDPGVTILEQVCYAFTELGYCNNFPIKDILTQQDNTLLIKDQFYVPDEILTTSPITITDYIKYVIDRVSSVQNVIISPVKSNLTLVSGIYEVYLQIDAEITDPKTIQNIATSAFFVLNTGRNLGEFFLMPKALTPVKYKMYGDLEIESDYDLNSILSTIQYEVNNYIFPRVTQTGYDKLKDEGETTNTIFNGPVLDKGWIPDSSIQPKKNTIRAFEITKLIQSIPGVKSIMRLSFETSDGLVYEINSENDQILVLDFIQSLDQKEQFQVSTKGKNIDSGINTDYVNELAVMQQPKTQINTVAAVKMTPDLPRGKYRDITSYYSIQNTFPAAYAVGNDSIDSNASDFQIAQSRQLKGYLTLFDQVLTNQFAQLANVGTLFSFKNAITGTSHDREEFFNTKDPFQKHHLKYPAPFKSFSPTYFYQSLYESAPHIRPLLRNFEAFNFSFKIVSLSQLDKDAWKAYKDDPYNTYIRGLLSFMEDEDINIKRRNEILDHLLARHGESPAVIDTIIDSTIYSGDLLKDQVIIKSLLLQNLGTLSYYRAKAYNYIGAEKLSAKFPPVTEKLQRKFAQGNLNDFIFNLSRIDQQERITQQDCINYATVELKLSLLFALKESYQNYLADHKSSIALWMITQRKGLLCIETNLLIESADFEIIITENPEQGPFLVTNTAVDYETLMLSEGKLQDQNTTSDVFKSKALYNNGSMVSFKETANGNWSKDLFTPISGTSLYWAVNASWGGKHSISIQDSIFNNTVLFIFPDFIPDLNTPKFKYRLDAYLESELSVQVTSKCFFLDEDTLKYLIPEFVQWHNDLVYDDKNSTIHGSSLIESSGMLAANIVQLNDLAND